MKSHIQTLLAQAIAQTQADGLLADLIPEIVIERTRDKQHGDFACNVALTLARAARITPRALAELIVQRLPASPQISRVEIAGPGFINFFIAATAFTSVVGAVLAAGDDFGKSQRGQGAAVQVEFVSANPNGPLHVGHGRGAAIGSCIANLLAAIGFNVQREYYVNDAGRQMDILTVSVWLRYLALCGEAVAFPANGYKGDYVVTIAQGLLTEQGRRLCRSAKQVFSDLPADLVKDDSGSVVSGDKEAHIDALIARARQLLGDADYRMMFDLGLNIILADIRADLSAFGVNFDTWFSERSLDEDGSVATAIQGLKASGDLYQEAGAWWFRSTAYGDEKDRVVVRENGQQTYFASDIGYHLGKLQRGFERIINVWGADHHGYVPRVKAALTALGQDASKLDVVLVQFAILYRGEERAQMSTRSGEFVTLRELREEVGNDAARFFYVMRKSDQHLDFDLELAKARSNENPVFYVQYAHARICSVLRQADERGLAWQSERGLLHLYLLVEEHEQALAMTLARYPELALQAALAYEPHQLAYYLKELATDFHTYYNAHAFLVDNDDMRDARLSLLVATRQVLRNGLGLLGVSAPDAM